MKLIYIISADILHEKNKMDSKSIMALACVSALVFVMGVSASEVETKVGEVIVYPQSVSLIKETGTTGTGTQFLTKVNGNAYIDSLRIVGASEISIMTPEWMSQSISEQILSQLIGEQVTVGNNSGTLKWTKSSWVGLLSPVGFISMPLSSDDITSIGEIAEPKNYKDAKYDVNWLGSANSPVAMSYLSSGLSWEPIYFLDATETGASRFEFWAEVDNTLEDLDATIKLVGGEINVYNTGSNRASMDYDDGMYYAEAAMAPSPKMGGGSAPTVSTSGEYEVYDLGKRALLKDESRLVSIFAGAVNPVREYVWDTYSSDVERNYKIENTGRAWPAGTVKVYENGMLMGEDSISWTAKGADADIVIGNAPDIVVEKKTDSSNVNKRDLGSDDYGYKVTLSIENNKAQSVIVSVTDHIPSYIMEGTLTIPAELEQAPGNELVGNVTVGSGQTKEIVYTYMT